MFGGPGAVPAEVFEALTAYARSGAVTRIEGDDRQDTAAQIADALPDRVADADRLDGLDSTAFVRRDPAAEPETRYATCGILDMAGQVDRTTRVNTTEYTYLRLAGGESSAHLSCNIAIPQGATIQGLGYDARDSSATGRLGCLYLRVIDRCTVPPVQLGQYDPDLGSSDPFLTTGDSVPATPGDVRMRTGLDDGPVDAGSHIHAHGAEFVADVVGHHRR